MLDPGWSLRIYGSHALHSTHPILGKIATFVTMPTFTQSKFGSRVAASRPGRIALEQTWLAAVSRKDDVVHHVGGTVPFIRPGRAMVTIHDLQPVDLPSNFGPLKRRWLGAMIPYGARQSDLVLCPSRFTADRLIERYAIPRERLRVIPHGLDPSDVQQQPADQLQPNDSPELFARLQKGQYLLYPAITHRHKRHGDLLAAFDKLANRYRNLALVFTGREGPETPSLQREAARMGWTDRVHFLGRIPNTELHRLYRSASAVVFPSAYEGFGIPALEAMLHGRPLITSDAGALPEVVGDAGLVVPVGNVDALTAAVSKVLDDTALANELSRRGPIRAQKFSVATSASALLDVYREVCSQHH